MTAPSWTLRRARPDDRAFLLALKAETMKDYVERVWGWDDAEQLAYFDDRFTPERWQIIQAERQDVGVLIVEESDDEVYLAEIEILPAWQGRGIGSAIIRSLMARAAQAGKPLTLRVLHVNTRARDLYERIGFRVFNEIDTHAYLRWDAPPSVADRSELVLADRRVPSHQPAGYICPFCGIVAGRDSDWNAQSDVVFRDERTTAFVCPRWWEAAPGHVLVVPNEHLENIYAVPDDQLAAVYRTSKRIAAALRSALACEGTSMRQHNEPGGGQDVWHFHVHVFARHRDDRLYERNDETRVASAAERARLAELIRGALYGS